MNIEIPQSQLEAVLKQSAEFINGATPHLEKLASMNETLEKFAKSTADSLASNGLIKASEVDKVANDIVEGGMSKVSELFDFVIKNVGVRQMGKAASDTTATSRPMTADEAFLSRLGLQTN